MDDIRVDTTFETFELKRWDLFENKFVEGKWMIRRSSILAADLTRRRTGDDDDDFEWEHEFYLADVLSVQVLAMLEFMTI